MGKTANNSRNSPKQRIVVIAERLLQQRSASRSLSVDDNFEDIGMNSMDLAKLVLLVEEEFGLVLGRRDLTPANFRSVSSISRLVDKLTRPQMDAHVR